MTMSPETRRAIGLILLYSAMLFFLIGWAAQMKSDFHGRDTICKAGFTAGAVFAAGGLVSLLFSRASKRP